MRRALGLAVAVVALVGGAALAQQRGDLGGETATRQGNFISTGAHRINLNRIDYIEAGRVNGETFFLVYVGGRDLPIKLSESDAAPLLNATGSHAMAPPDDSRTRPRPELPEIAPHVGDDVLPAVPRRDEE